MLFKNPPKIIYIDVDDKSKKGEIMMNKNTILRQKDKNKMEIISN